MRGEPSKESSTRNTWIRPGVLRITEQLYVPDLESQAEATKARFIDAPSLVVFCDVTSAGAFPLFALQFSSVLKEISCSVHEQMSLKPSAVSSHFF